MEKLEPEIEFLSSYSHKFTGEMRLSFALIAPKIIQTTFCLY